MYRVFNLQNIATKWMQQTQSVYLSPVTARIIIYHTRNENLNKASHQFLFFLDIINYSSASLSTTVTLTRCQALLLIPLKFQIPFTVSGWTLCEASTAFEIIVIC